LNTRYAKEKVEDPLPPPHTFRVIRNFWTLPYPRLIFRVFWNHRNKIHATQKEYGEGGGGGGGGSENTSGTLILKEP